MFVVGWYRGREGCPDDVLRPGAGDRSGLSVESKANRWYVYILRCSDGTLYTGIANNLDKRLRAHNDGSGARYTRSRRPVELVYRETAESRSAATVREAAIKRMSRKKKLEMIRDAARSS